MQLKDAVVIVTGASSGIGEATALALAARGAKIALAARRADRLHALKARVEAAGGQAIAVATDVTDRASVLALAAATEAAFGPVDVLVNNAGVMLLSFMAHGHVEEWDRMIDVNVKGPLYGIHAVLPGMIERKRGHIINISSVAGRRVYATGAVYCATKFALNAITEGLRLELARSHGVRFTSVEPGMVATELLDHITDPAVSQRYEQMGHVEPLTADDVARAVLYALEQPAHVHVNEVLVMPTTQP
ncbi:MAG: SDR family oxidoreductase [Myxococcales bacterium]|nr:SDR family oxidoreductase [Myxococcales bacterium]